jgi:GNAT superfamily N-acetyltransferase
VTAATGKAITIRALTPSRWPDLERLFGERGACGGCWCMWWRITRAQWNAQKGEKNRRALKAYVEAGGRPGLMAYLGRRPVGWIAVEPREAYPALGRSQSLKPVDDRPVWSITCFFVERNHRGRGIARALVDAAVAHVGKKGGTLVEAYPVEPASDKRLPDAFAWHGLASMFRAAGFREVARPSATRSIMRREVEAGR